MIKFVICDGWPSAVLEIHSDQSVLSLLKLPIIWIMGLCLIAGAASITFIESTLSLYLDKQVSHHSAMLSQIWSICVIFLRCE